LYKYVLLLLVVTTCSTDVRTDEARTQLQLATEIV
jgi:hypothetical protein